MCNIKEKLEKVKAETESQGMSGQGRLTSKGVLRDRIERLRRRADMLETLLDELPDDLSHEADEAFWQLVVEVHRV